MDGGAVRDMAISILAGPASREMARGIADSLSSSNIDSRLVDVDLRVFPDGESRIRIDKHLEGDDIVLVQSTYPPVDTHMMQLFFMLSRASRLGSRLVAVIPYLGYARQDREFLPGEVVSIEVIAGIVSSYRPAALITFDAHSMLALSYFGMPVHNLSAVPLLAEYFRTRLAEEKIHAEDVLAVSPDAGGAGRAKAFADVLGCRSIALKKSRDRITGSISIDHEMLRAMRSDLKDKVAIVVDDMISTGGSVAEAAKVLLEYGCRSVHVACTHALMLGDAAERIIGSGAGEIVATNTVPGRGVSRVIDVAPLAASAVLRVLSNGTGADHGESKSKDSIVM